MSETIEVGLALALSWLLGAGVLRRLGIDPREDALAFLAWATAAGTFATGAFLFAWLALRGPLAAGTPVFLVAAATTLLLLVPARRRPTPISERARQEFPLAERALFWATLLLGLIRLADVSNTGNYRPIVEGDEAVIWSAKAKALFAAEGFGEGFLEKMADPYQPWAKDYPLLNPLLQVWAFAGVGRITHAANRLPSQATLAAVLLMAASALRRRARPGLAALLLLILLPSTTSPIFGHAIYADPMVALGLLIAFDAWLRRREGSLPRAAPFLLSLGLAYAVASKHEGLLFLATVAASAAAARLARGASPPARSRLAWVFALPLAWAAATWTVNHLTGIASQNEFLRPDAAGRGLPARLLAQIGERTGPILAEMGRRVVLDARWTNLLVAAFLSLSIARPRLVLRGELRTPTLALALALAGVAGTYVVTPRSVADHMDFSLHRVIYQVLPATALWVGVVLARIEPRFSASAAGAPR